VDAPCFGTLVCTEKNFPDIQGNVRINRFGQSTYTSFNQNDLKGCKAEDSMSPVSLRQKKPNYYVLMKMSSTSTYPLSYDDAGTPFFTVGHYLSRSKCFETK
jgi:hypothetical protein